MRFSPSCSRFARHACDGGDLPRTVELGGRVLRGPVHRLPPPDGVVGEGATASCPHCRHPVLTHPIHAANRSGAPVRVHADPLKYWPLFGLARRPAGRPANGRRTRYIAVAEAARHFVEETVDTGNSTQGSGFPRCAGPVRRPLVVELATRAAGAHVQLVGELLDARHWRRARGPTAIHGPRQLRLRASVHQASALGNGDQPRA